MTEHHARLRARGSRGVSRLRGAGVGLAASIESLRRVAMLSVHTSPLHQPGTGDAGGMNVYIVELARRLAASASRSRSSPGPPPAACRRRSSWPPASWCGTSTPGPYEGLAKEDLPAQLCAFTHGRDARRGPATGPATTTWSTPTTGCPGTSAGSPPQRWGVPLVHAMHTMAKVKNAALADGDTPEPRRPRHRRDADRSAPPTG